MALTLGGTTDRLVLSLLLVTLCACFSPRAALAQRPQVRVAQNNGPQTPSAPGAQGGQNVPAGPHAQPARAPFLLNAQDEQILNSVLQKWEQRNSSIKTFKCAFIRLDYDQQWGPGAGIPFMEGKGELKYKAPDHGLFQLTEMYKYDPAAKRCTIKQEVLDHWVCDGKSIFEFNHQKKQLIQHKLPPHMQGKAIAEGPLPFVFGAKADAIKQRYFIRVTRIEPLANTNDRGVFLEAFPRFQRDAANFDHVEIILTERDFLPYGLNTYLPGGKSNTVYLFENRKENGILDFLEFGEPRLPFMWKKVVDNGQPPAPTAQSPPVDRKGQPSQAQRGLMPLFRRK